MERRQMQHSARHIYEYVRTQLRSTLMRQCLQTQQSSRHYLASEQTSTAEQASKLTVQQKRSLTLPLLRLNPCSK